MTALRLISLPIHTGLELALGLLLMAAPIVLGLGFAPAVIGVVVGALVVGLALHAVDAGGRALPVATHHAYDHGLALGLAAAAGLGALAGDVPATLLFGGFALAQLALTLTTRYSAA